MMYHPLWTSYFFAVLSAAVYVIPTLFQLVGIGGFASGLFDMLGRIRPIFAAISVVLLCVAFYYSYIRQVTFGNDNLNYSRHHFWVAVIIILLLLTVQMWGPSIIH